MFRTIAFALPVLLTVLPAQEKATQDKAGQDKPATELWVTDFAKAKTQAKAEKKDLLVDFTGSDWCGWCMKLDEEVFSQDAFTAGAPKSFVLVKLDYPHKKELPAELKEQNKKLVKQYPIQGYPTIMLMDADGHVYGLTGYEAGGADKYLEMLADMKKKGGEYQTALAKATSLKGADRAKALDAALGTLEEDVVNGHHLACMQEIVALDADGKAGLKSKYEPKVKEIGDTRELEGVNGELNELIAPSMQEHKGKEAIAKLDEVIKAPKSKVHHQMALFFKGMITMEVDNDAKAAVAALEAAKTILPESLVAKRIDEILPEMKKQLDDKKDKEEKKDEKGGK
jgi:thioredoxin-related protein